MYDGDATKAYSAYLRDGEELFFRNYQVFDKARRANAKASFELFADTYDDVVADMYGDDDPKAYEDYLAQGAS